MKMLFGKSLRNWRLLYIPLDYHRHTEDPMLFSDILDAFGKQINVKIFAGIDDAINWKPDVIFFQGSLSLEECFELKNKTNALFTMWTGDARYAPNPSLLLYKEVVDLFLLPFDGKTRYLYKAALQKECAFIWEPIQNWRFKSPQYLNDGSVVFVGNLYDNFPGGEKRLEIIEFLSGRIKDFEFRGNLIGNASPIDYKLVPEYYNNAYITICENNYDDIESYFTPRNIGAMAAGSCSLHRIFPSIENFFWNGSNCFHYRNKYELLEYIYFLQTNPKVRNRIAQEGYKHAYERFTADNWVTKYLDILTKNYT